MNTNMKRINIGQVWSRVMGSRGTIFGIIIFGALIAFEFFNYTTTQFALHDVLGDLTFLGMQWATILALAFCGIDFAGIARIFTPEQGRDEPTEVWYLFGAWLLAAVMNATLTWWGVSVAIQERGAIAGTAVVGSETVTKVVPIFVAMMVLTIRVLIIGTFSSMGDRLFHSDARRKPYSQQNNAPARPTSTMRPTVNPQRPVSTNNTYRAAPSNSQVRNGTYARSEPTYHNVQSASSARDDRVYMD